MWFYSMLNGENKTYDWKNSPNYALFIFKLPLCTKEMPYSAHWKSNEQ